MELRHLFSVTVLLVSIGTSRTFGIDYHDSDLDLTTSEIVVSTPTENENNDTYQSANTMELNGSIAGTININNDYYDYFKVTLPFDGKISFSIIPEAIVDAYLDLYDWNGINFLRTSNQTGAGVPDMLTYENLKTGTYYIRVGGGGNGSYSLTNVFTPTAFPNGNDDEPNDTQPESSTINSNDSQTGHLGYFGNGSADYYDYYKFTITSDGKVAFAIQPEKTLDAYLDLYDWNGTNFLRSSLQTGVGIADSLIYENLKAGTYFIRVGGGGYGSYTLTNTFTPTAIPNGNDDEPNDNYNEAVPIYLNSAATGHLNYFGNGSGDFYDWYKFSISEKGTVTFYITPESSLDTYIDLYTANGNSFLKTSSNSGLGQVDSLVYNNLEPGDYYIKTAGSGYGSYTLSSLPLKPMVSVNKAVMSQIKILFDPHERLLKIENISVSNYSSIEIIDMLGKTIRKENLLNNNNQFHIDTYKGIFLIMVHSEKETVVKRMAF